VALLFLFTFGCEKVDVITPTVNYKDMIVVRSELKAYSVFQGVSFTKTLPLDEVYDIKNAELKNVTAYLRINEIRIVTLKYSNNGIYLPLDNINVQPGETYELFAEVDGKPIYCKTKIPMLPIVVSASLKDNRLIEVTIQPKANEVYGAAWEIYNSNNGILLDEAADFQTIIQPTQDEIKSELILSTKDLPEKYITASYNSYFYAEVFAFDEPYLKFFKTKNNNQPMENIFAQGGDQINWNVEGENVIGLFIGLANVSHIKVKY
jgi:hypothetical protein